ncbi:unnamed protein product [Haemonchus placei]|uniref:TIR domain-containing protein n=1 Tax=Haemonchus placei TaxID=6290 RepID=A0A0N4WHB7_HAEPC|nr:unnamed protein product [Haemonchus placei]
MCVLTRFSDSRQVYHYDAENYNFELLGSLDSCLIGKLSCLTGKLSFGYFIGILARMDIFPRRFELCLKNVARWADYCFCILPGIDDSPPLNSVLADKMLECSAFEVNVVLIFAPLSEHDIAAADTGLRSASAHMVIIKSADELEWALFGSALEPL